MFYKLKKKVASKFEASLYPIINKFLNASHEVAVLNGCNLTFEEFECQIRDLLSKESEKD